MIGLRIRNQSSIVQIDPAFQNMQLYTTGTITCNQVDGERGVGHGYLDVNLNTLVSLIAIRTVNGTRAFVRRDGDRFKITATLVSTGVYGVVTYYIFRQPGYLSLPQRAGLRMRNANGTTFYDSRFKYMRVLGVFTGQVGLNQTLNFNGGSRKIAIVQSSRPKHLRKDIISSGGQNAFIISSGTGGIQTPNDVSGTVLFADMSTLGPAPGGGVNEEYTITNYQYMVLDVTDY